MPAAVPYFFIKTWRVVRSMGRFASTGRSARGSCRALSTRRGAPGLLRAPGSGGRKTREPTPQASARAGLSVLVRIFQTAHRAYPYVGALVRLLDLLREQ